MLLDRLPGHALLLQGPVGPFFARFADELRSRGARVTKLNFNAGDALFYRGRGAVAYRGRMEDWPAFFRDLVTRESVDAVYLFGDCRPIHLPAIAIARELGIDVWVFEEGYLRPDYITVERGGVNGHSSLPKDAGFYRRMTSGLPELPSPLPVGHTFLFAATYAILYALALTCFGWRYPRYRHHRPLNAFAQAALWLRGFGRKLWYSLRERGVLARVEREWDGRYFFVPLQVHCDAQVSHSPFASVEAFIDEVVRTFAACAPPETLLIFKHHPQDRAYRDYGRYLRALAARHGVSDRIVYVHDLHLPTLLRHARGTVTMNSTVGLSSIHHRTPLIALGEAIYDIPGLTFQGDLASFFHAPDPVDEDLYLAFCRWLREINQVNGSFYKRLPGIGGESGLRMPVHAAPLRIDDGHWSAPIEKSA